MAHMIETIIICSFNVFSIVTCYVLGYRKGIRNVETETEPETRDCICGHAVNNHSQYDERIGTCVVSVKFIGEKSFSCACQKYTPKPYSEMI